MRLAIFIFVCFAASTAFNSTQSNYSRARVEVEKLKAIPNDIPRVSSNSSLTRQLRKEKVDQPVWCKKLDNQPINEILANCKELSDITAVYVLRIGKDVTDEEWKKFIGNMISISTHVEIIGSEITELILPLNKLHANYKKLVIKNNLKMERIVMKSKEKLQDAAAPMLLEMKGNPALKSIKIEGNGNEYNGDDLTISENGELETVEFNAPQFVQILKTGRWNISNNPKLHRIQINCKEFWIESRIYIVGNKALTGLNFPETLERFGISEMYIIENDNLETIKIPATGDHSKQFQAKKLEIRQNKKLKTIDLGKEARWKDTKRIIEENPLASAVIYETTTTTTTRAPRDDNNLGDDKNWWTKGREAIPIAIFPSLLILGYSA